MARVSWNSVKVGDKPYPTQEEWAAIAESATTVEAMPKQKGGRGGKMLPPFMDQFLDGKVYFFPHEDQTVLARMEHSLRTRAYAKNIGFTCRFQSNPQGLYIQALPDKPRQPRQPK